MLSQMKSFKCHGELPNRSDENSFVSVIRTASWSNTFKSTAFTIQEFWRKSPTYSDP